MWIFLIQNVPEVVYLIYLLYTVRGARLGGLIIALLRPQRCCLTPSLQLLLDLKRTEHILPLQDQLFRTGTVSSCS